MVCTISVNCVDSVNCSKHFFRLFLKIANGCRNPHNSRYDNLKANPSLHLSCGRVVTWSSSEGRKVAWTPRWPAPVHEESADAAVAAGQDGQGTPLVFHLCGTKYSWSWSFWFDVAVRWCCLLMITSQIKQLKRGFLRFLMWSFRLLPLLNSLRTFHILIVSFVQWLEPLRLEMTLPWPAMLSYTRTCAPGAKICACTTIVERKTFVHMSHAKSFLCVIIGLIILFVRKASVTLITLPGVQIVLFHVFEMKCAALKTSLQLGSSQ